MKLMAHLNFNGQCREAFEHYAAVLGGEIAAMSEMGAGEDLPPDCPPDLPERIKYAELRVGDQTIVGSDNYSSAPATMTSFNVALHTEKKEEAQRIFEALSKGGNVTFALAETPWSPAFGMVTDRFGTPWMICVV